jgi:hypothetical protein
MMRMYRYNLLFQTSPWPLKPIPKNGTSPSRVYTSLREVQIRPETTTTTKVTNLSCPSMLLLPALLTEIGSFTRLLPYRLARVIPIAIVDCAAMPRSLNALQSDEFTLAKLSYPDHETEQEHPYPFQLVKGGVEPVQFCVELAG